jgi:ATP-dependent Clp protease ATP-binding subunit ClpA
MRMDKLTSRFQQAIADAQSLAVGRDHTIIEPAHLLLALLDQQGARQALEKYTIDMTARAESGKLDPVIGRDEEIRRTIQVLRAAPRTTRC